MTAHDGPVALHRTVIETLTVDAMVLADEIETYFAGEGLEQALPQLSAAGQAAVARIGLKMATRIARLVEWLVRGEGSRPGQVTPPPEALALDEPLYTSGDIALLPPPARALAEATTMLFARVAAVFDPARPIAAVESPARLLQSRIAERFGLRSN